MKNKFSLKNILVMILILFVTAVSGTVRVHAESTVRDVGTEVGKSNLIEYNLVLDDYETNIEGTDAFLQYVSEGDEFFIVYNNAFTYNEEPLSIRLDIKFVDGGTGDKRDRIRVREDHYLAINTDLGPTDESVSNVSHWSVKYTILDKNGDLYPAKLFAGVSDPDGGNYEFDTTRGLFYVDSQNSDMSDDWLADNYYVTDKGLYAAYDDNNRGYENEGLFISPLKNSTFEMDIYCWSEGILYPHLYYIQYQIEYKPNGDDLKSPVINTMENQDVYEGDNGLNENLYEAAGYRFIGWNTKADRSGTPYDDKDNLNLIDKDFGKDLIVRTLYAQWEPIEYKLEYNKNHPDAVGTMEGQVANIGDNDLHENEFTLKGYKFIGWSTKEGENPVEYQPTDTNVPVTGEDVKDKVEGDTVKVLYAQWEPLDYTILYDANGGKGNMDPNEYKGSDETMLSEKEWTFTREGYSFAGFKVENSGETYNGSKDFKDTLLDDDDRKITLFAQWEPWKYQIKYEPNGGVGEMKTQTFVYTDDKMNSNKNQFVRDGYEFIGFEFEHKGAKYIITSTKDFNDMLKELGPNSSITLVAQWRKLPDPIVKYYALPVTGVEDHR